MILSCRCFCCCCRCPGGTLVLTVLLLLLQMAWWRSLRTPQPCWNVAGGCSGQPMLAGSCSGQPCWNVLGAVAAYTPGRGGGGLGRPGRVAGPGTNMSHMACRYSLPAEGHVAPRCGMPHLAATASLLLPAGGLGVCLPCPTVALL